MAEGGATSSRTSARGIGGGAGLPEELGASAGPAKDTPFMPAAFGGGFGIVLGGGGEGEGGFGEGGFREAALGVRVGERPLGVGEVLLGVDEVLLGVVGRTFGVGERPLGELSGVLTGCLFAFGCC